jgi:hypothetical protein
MLAPPIVHVEAIDRDQLNRALVAWEHKMGPWTRPDYGAERFHGLFHNGELVAVSATGSLIAETCAGLRRHEAIELGRLCAARPGLCRAMLRLWREFVFPALGHPWAVSYQDSVEHTGNLYRFDGWVQLGTSRSGTDKRGERRGRSKIIWGWAHTAEAMEQRRAA